MHLSFNKLNIIYHSRYFLRADHQIEVRLYKGLLLESNDEFVVLPGWNFSNATDEEGLVIS